MKKLLEDNDGNKSSKRIYSGIILITWLVISVVIIFKTEDITINKMQVLNQIGMVGGSLAGISVFEKFAKKK